MLAFALAMMLNVPSLDEQRERLSAHAGNALAVGGLVFAAGIFTGILSGTQMVDAMAATVTHAVPESMGPYLAPITAVLSAPFTRSEEHTSELQSLMRISYAVFCLKQKNNIIHIT